METWDTNSNAGERGRRTAPAELMGLAIAWSRDEPERVGEVALLEPGTDAERCLGRGLEGEQPRLRFVRQRPGHTSTTPALVGKRLSRDQLWVSAVGDTLVLRNVGKRTLLVDGREVGGGRCSVRDGDVVELRGELVLVVVRRPRELPAQELPDSLSPAFGQADAHGLVGESPLAWELRGRVAFAAARDVHVFIGGPSGTGKELVAQAIHGLSSRGARAMVSRNAATFPEALIDAELFGNLADYPNPGMPERPGLIGAADRSTLFLDEIGELSTELQAHLLRVLDDGEYQRLGESKLRRADIRLIAATNRASEELKHDLIARLRLRLELPGLSQRREDIPLLVPFLIRRIAAEDPALAERFFPDGDPGASPRVDPSLIRHLLGFAYQTHVRELEGLLWTAMMDSVVAGREEIGLSGAAVEALGGEQARASVEPSELGREQIAAALAEVDGNQSRAWRLLGLRSRHQLVRLIKKHGL